MTHSRRSFPLNLAIRARYENGFNTSTNGAIVFVKPKNNINPFIAIQFKVQNDTMEKATELYTFKG